MADDLPLNDYYEYFAPDYKLHIPVDCSVPNMNKREHLEKVSRHCMAQGCCMHTWHSRNVHCCACWGRPGGRLALMLGLHGMACLLQVRSTVLENLRR